MEIPSYLNPRPDRLCAGLSYVLFTLGINPHCLHDVRVHSDCAGKYTNGSIFLNPHILNRTSLIPGRFNDSSRKIIIYPIRRIYACPCPHPCLRRSKHVSLDLVWLFVLAVSLRVCPVL
ncbi:hypothetical protein DENSPDRAFT_193640 [Dentipellis sp. KUC8613]|nr:hypothetical protein DENSPDRAFT_193640 [Dentipellis sp. KUC8613]